MRLALLPFLVLLTPAPLVAQSLLGAGGLGVPITPVNARAQALGSLGIGLTGAAILPADPAAAADLVYPALTFTIRQSWVDLEGGDTEPSASGSRFPVMGIAYPVKDWGMATLTFNTVFDQRWDVELERLVDLGSENARVTDSFVSDGGVSVVRVGFARRVAPSLAVGVTAGRYLGGLSRDFTRTFDSLAVERDVTPFREGGRWSFSAPTVSGGVQVDVGNVLRVAGSVTWSGSLRADPDDGTAGAAAEFDLPLEYRLGASGVLAPELQATVSMAYADWSGTDGSGVADGGGASATMDLGAGLEWTAGSIGGRRTPLRVGWRRTEFPFRFDAEDASESAWAAGFGLDLVRSGGVSLAGADFAIERGERSAGALSESFWRATLSLQVAGL